MNDFDNSYKAIAQKKDIYYKKGRFLYYLQKNKKKSSFQNEDNSLEENFDLENFAQNQIEKNNAYFNKKSSIKNNLRVSIIFDSSKYALNTKIPLFQRKNIDNKSRSLKKKGTIITEKIILKTGINDYKIQKYINMINLDKNYLYLGCSFFHFFAKKK